MTAPQRSPFLSVEFVRQLNEVDSRTQPDGAVGRSGGIPAGAGPDLWRDATVLIVDDEPVNVALLERLLRWAGIGDVHAVTDPRQAVERCLQVRPDLVLLDLHMPHMDGLAVLTALRATLPADGFLPVLVLTADVTTEARDRALDAGANDFLTKPFDRTEVVLRVRNLLETRALYADVQRHNTALRADLVRRTEAERRGAEDRRQRAARIREVLAGDGLTMVFQPVADLRSGTVLGVEALARFSAQPRRPPNEWFDEATTLGLGPELELTAVRAALVHFDEVPPEGFLALNISPGTATAPELVELLSGVPSERVVLELTEHARVNDYDVLLAALQPLRDRGVRIAVDDAGAGYAGLQHVLRLQPEVLKLDIALTRGIDTDPARRALATALVSFASEIRATIIAEGIETAAELATLRGLSVPWGQGYHLARPGTLPVPAERLQTREQRA
jgi:EAL domain-containing protein (putative c-di-GMP-specific phosphodiesterase class I)/CheY-like chemotaxis protein